MSDGSGEIIIKGGSCEIYFNPEVFRQDPADPKKHKTETLNIEQIVISGDGQVPDYDSGDITSKFQGTIKIICK